MYVCSYLLHLLAPLRRASVRTYERTYERVGLILPTAKDRYVPPELNTADDEDVRQSSHTRNFVSIQCQGQVQAAVRRHTVHLDVLSDAVLLLLYPMKQRQRASSW